MPKCCCRRGVHRAEKIAELPAETIGSKRFIRVMNRADHKDKMQLICRYRVVIVDDEPIAVKAIERILERNCPDYVTVGTADNGLAALELIRKTMPDLVLTDITMPAMNGLELAQTVSGEFPDTCFVVISGYQDFEYMRSAIQSGVLDYLVKPIVPSQIVSMMQRVREKLRVRFYHKRNTLLRSACLGGEISREEIKRYFPHEKYYAALLRENGLPRRFFRTGEPELFGSMEEAYCVYGRDSMEELFLIPSMLFVDQSIEQYMDKVSKRQKSEDSYITLLYHGSAFPPDRLVSKVRDLYYWLNELSVVGLSQRIDLEKSGKDAERKVNPDTGELRILLQELEGYARSGCYDQMRQKISRTFAHWGEEGRPQLWMEHAARRLLNFIRMESGDEQSLLESEYGLEDAFYYATSIPMLCENLQSLFYRFHDEQKEKPKVDSQDFFDGIVQYLKEHLSQPLSLQSLCDEFAISQAYMSKLFRKYADQSYAQYLTGLRIEKAKALMREEKELYIKDIATMAGYQDQFYFSRIFRSYEGMSPADYMKSGK